MKIKSDQSESFKHYLTLKDNGIWNSYSLQCISLWHQTHSALSQNYYVMHYKHSIRIRFFGPRLVLLKIWMMATNYSFVFIHCFKWSTVVQSHQWFGGRHVPSQRVKQTSNLTSYIFGLIIWTLSIWMMATNYSFVSFAFLNYTLGLHQPDLRFYHVILLLSQADLPLIIPQYESLLSCSIYGHSNLFVVLIALNKKT